MQLQARRKLAIGAVALAACSFGGGAYAATQVSDSSTPRAFLNDVARRLGVTPQKLSAALEGAATDQVNAAVRAGRLTRAQANAIERQIRAHGQLPPFLPWAGPHRLFRMGSDGPPGVAFSAAAKYLGISTTELRSELRSGKTLRQIANARGKSAAGLEMAIATAIRSHVPRLAPQRHWRLPFGDAGAPPAGFGPGAPPAGFGPGAPTPPASS